jgi:uncharacterized protein
MTSRAPARSFVCRLFCVVVVAGTGCPTTTTTPPPGETDRRAFTANLVDEIVIPMLADFVDASAALQRATAAGGSDATAQQAWREAMRGWQGLEMIHLGPAASPADFVGGAGLRERMYAWPQINVCAIDQQVVANTFSDAGWVDTRLPNVIGLAAIEYALFASTANACPAAAPINADGSWAALGDQEVRRRRDGYAAVLAADVATRAAALHAVWTQPGGFADGLRTAGETGSSFSTAQQALDEVYAALFAVELTVKDKKLAIPAGLHIGCEAATCADKLESRFAQTSKENVLHNLEATRRIFLGIDRNGVDDSGFDDLLRERGAAELASTMTTNLDAAIAGLNAFDGSFEAALAVDGARVAGVFQLVKAFTDDFKSTFPSALGLRVPEEGAGDND